MPLNTSVRSGKGDNLASFDGNLNQRFQEPSLDNDQIDYGQMTAFVANILSELCLNLQ